jgi:hypothetical protein
MKINQISVMNSPRAWGGGRPYGRVDVSAIRHSVDCDGGGGGGQRHILLRASHPPPRIPSIPPRRFSFSRQIPAYFLYASTSPCSRIREDGASSVWDRFGFFFANFGSLRGTAASRVGRWITMSNFFCNELRCAHDYKAMAGECSLT